MVVHTGAVVDDIVEDIDSVKACSFFLTLTHCQASTVFGTMIAFYFLTLCIIILLISICQMKDLDNIWHFDLNLTNMFWVFLGWLCLFIIESSIIEKDKENFDMVNVGMVDIAMLYLYHSVCIIRKKLLFVSAVVIKVVASLNKLARINHLNGHMWGFTFYSRGHTRSNINKFLHH